jgi:deoxyribonuclease V
MLIPRSPHRWNVTPARAVEIQRWLATRVRIEPPLGPLRYVAGVDSAFTDDQCVAGVVLWDAREAKVLEAHTAWRPLTFPYVPGLLSFREAPAILAALRKLGRRPDALLVDGQGIAHPRRFGIACHLGVITGLPTAGCAKSRLVGEHREPAARRGSRAPLTDGDDVLGSVLRTLEGASPLFVSVGHALDQDTAERLVLSCGAGHRLPEPTHRADRLVAAAKRERSEARQPRTRAVSRSRRRRGAKRGTARRARP